MPQVAQQDSICRQWHVSGRVHGVGFRWFVRRLAREMNLDGTVRNLPDGTVEVIARGDTEDLQKLAIALKRGPLTARVTSVTESPGFLAASNKGFGVEHGS
jgi:acylphosphatase